LIISILGQKMIDSVNSMKRLRLLSNLMGEKFNLRSFDVISRKFSLSLNCLIFYISKFKVLWDNG